ncbi:MAG: TonB-dependent receptor [Alphaproteobacteria bacterium]|nr:TonB-dependent receptor [Alphaproteobacteria bacterium]MBU1516847.1 TonB-dependent receptor [Alphaproteobacteria bacterium]MBU2092541.1 TonB-dependent receptor [Alphaproteobacteria bacterium]MBU2151347.1 TonB-dependent receptor [Alphaproteobacteria bacterium]MBU2309650.1 TonB-dependent receptor [Alphaproteobacteria bacterium]
MRALLGGVALACLAGRAEAADARLRFTIPARSYADALIDLGLQANISILGTASCGSGGRVELSGRRTLRDALDQVLAGAPCRYTIIDDRTVRILPGGPPRTPIVTHEAPRAPALVSEVVVTATKRPASLDQLPAGVSAISRNQIVSTRAVDVGQATGQLAGVLTTNLGPGRDKLLIRGLSDGAFTGRTRSTVSTYLDDAPINYNAPDPDLRLVDIDRIEVVRGPQGALYGSGSLAGVFRIVTSKPDLERPAFGATAGVASTKGGDRSRELDGYVSLPIVRDRIAIRLAAYEDVQGGYLDDVNLRIANVDQTRRDGGRIAVRVRIDDHWRLDALAATQHLRSNDTQYITTPIGSPPSSGVAAMALEEGWNSAPGERRSLVREAHNNDFSYGGVTLQGDFEWGSITSSTSYVHHVFSSQFDATRALEPNEALGGVPTNIGDLGVFTEATRSNMLVQDLVVRSSGVGPFDWLVGIYGARTMERNPSTLGVLSVGPAVMSAYTEYRKDRQREYAIYGEGAYELGDGWSVTVGGRFFETEVRTTAQLDIVAPYRPRFFDQARTFNGFSPKISLQRQFSNGDLVYGLVTEGYRPGGFNSSGFLPIRPSRTTFSPDRLRNYEVGVKLRRLDSRLGVRAAAYYDDWSNIQTDRYRNSGLAYTANVADAQIIGLEAEVAYDWPFGLSLQANGLISDSRVRNRNPDFEAPVPSELPGVPNASGGVLAVYERPLGGDLSLRFSGEANYVGYAGLSFDATTPQRMGHYLRAKLSVEVASEHWRLMAYVTNPFDGAGDTFAYGNPFTFGKVRQVTPQRPRTVGLRLGAAF